MQLARPRSRNALIPSRTVTAALVVSAAALTVTGTSAMAAPPPAGTAAPAVVCIPEAPVCVGVEGVPGRYRFHFRVSPAPSPVGTSFTVNGAGASGSVSTRQTGGVLEGDFLPLVPLVTGDEVCLRLLGDSQRYCAITP